MLKSKALKEGALKSYAGDGEKRSKLYDWWIESKIADWWYNTSWKYFGNPIFQIKRLYQWYVKVFRYDYDFDGHCLFAIIEYKLIRIEKSLIKGHAIQEDVDMKALRLAIKLARRLKDDSYQEAFWDRHERKWGKMKTWFEPCTDRPSFSTWNSSRPKAVTEEEKELQREDFRKMCFAIDAKTDREQRWFFRILDKYLRIWWD